MKSLTYGLIGVWSQTLQIKLLSISKLQKIIFMNSKTEKTLNKLRELLKEVNMYKSELGNTTWAGVHGIRE